MTTVRFRIWEGRGQTTGDRSQKKEERDSPVGAAFQPRYHCFYDFYDLPFTTDYWILLGPSNGGESHYVRSQRR